MWTGTSSSAAGAASIDTCVDCGVGTYAAAAASACQTCTTGASSTDRMGLHFASMRVLIASHVGSGQSSLAASATCTYLPGTITLRDITIDGVTSNGCVCRWTRPHMGGSTTIAEESYRIVVSKAGVVVKTGVAAGVAADVQASYVITGLERATEYSITITARALVGTSR